ncbi:MAG: catechol 2,3-dioxygenase-like lactoylglutathione lyase family enzyme [Halieaceae bacterium]|jgi:catechol 2,3-dioxygenase-like lactoylglutathione lyase family enzyme
MIYIEHLNLVVKDIPAALSFYQGAFPHWKVRESGEGLWSGKPRKWVHFGDDHQYLTFNDNGVGEARGLGGHQPGLAHFAFVITNLDALIKRMEAAGFSVDKDGADEQWRKNVYYIDSDGFEVEFVEYLSDIPARRNASS